MYNFSNVQININVPHPHNTLPLHPLYILHVGSCVLCGTNGEPLDTFTTFDLLIIFEYLHLGAMYILFTNNNLTIFNLKEFPAVQPNVVA